MDGAAAPRAEWPGDPGRRPPLRGCYRPVSLRCMQTSVPEPWPLGRPGRGFVPKPRPQGSEALGDACLCRSDLKKCGRIIRYPKASAGPTSAHRTDQGLCPGSQAPVALAWGGVRGAARRLPDSGAQAPHESGQRWRPGSRRCGVQAHSPGGVHLAPPLPPAQAARSVLWGAAACSGARGVPTSSPAPSMETEGQGRVTSTRAAEPRPGWPRGLTSPTLGCVWWKAGHRPCSGLSWGTGPGPPAGTGHGRPAGQARSEGPSGHPDASLRVAADAMDRGRRRRADGAGEVGVRPGCSPGPGWGAATLPRPPPAQLQRWLAWAGATCCRGNGRQHSPPNRNPSIFSLPATFK